MNELKEQFQKARQAYQAVRYDGDLAVDVLEVRSRMIVFRRAAAAAAMAAMILLAVLFWPRADVKSGSAVSGNTSTAATGAGLTDLADASSDQEQVKETFSLTLIGSAGVSAPSLSNITTTSMAPTFSSMVVTEVPAITNVSRESEPTTSTTEKTL